jgi:integrase
MHQMCHAALRKARTRFGNKQHVTVCHKLRSRVTQILADPLSRAVANRDHAVFLAFVQRLMRACSNRAPTGIRNRALIVTLWRAQLRIGEALALKPSDIGEGTIRVLRGKSSTVSRPSTSKPKPS